MGLFLNKRCISFIWFAADFLNHLSNFRQCFILRLTVFTVVL